jgi:hypothetical protein
VNCACKGYCECEGRNIRSTTAARRNSECTIVTGENSAALIAHGDDTDTGHISKGTWIPLKEATAALACTTLFQAQKTATAREATMASVETSRRAAEAKAATSIAAQATLAINGMTTLKLPEPLWLH